MKNLTQGGPGQNHHFFGSLIKNLLFFDIAYLEVNASSLLRPYERQNFIIYTINKIIMIIFDY